MKRSAEFWRGADWQWVHGATRAHIAEELAAAEGREAGEKTTSTLPDVSMGGVRMSGNITDQPTAAEVIAAELDRLREAAPGNKWAVGKSPRNGRVQVHNGQIQVCAAWSTFANPAQGTAQYIAAMHNAYPALRQRLTEAESRLAEAERERDELRGKAHIEEIAEAGHWIDIIRRLDPERLCDAFDDYGIEQYLQQWLADRDAKQRRKGAAEWLVNKAAEIDSITSEDMLAYAQGLREGT